MSAHEFVLNIDGELLMVRKIQAHEFTRQHGETIAQARYADGRLRLPDPSWLALYLGAGEEKACFCLCDQQRRVFVLEVIDERHYLNGRYVGGEYFCERRASALENRPFSERALIGLTFTGLVKAREYVYGYEWGRFQFMPQRERRLDLLLTALLHTRYQRLYELYQERYRDVHDRNVLFEIRPPGESGLPVLLRDWAGRLQLRRVGVQPIDVR